MDSFIRIIMSSCGFNYRKVTELLRIFIKTSLAAVVFMTKSYTNKLYTSNIKRFKISIFLKKKKNKTIDE